MLSDYTAHSNCRGVRILDQQALKEQVAAAAVEHVANIYSDKLVLGIGTGSTAECFIRGLVGLRGRIETTVASSKRSAVLLAELNIPVTDLNSVHELDAYIDGADEANESLALIMGGGAAHTRIRRRLFTGGWDALGCHY